MHDPSTVAFEIKRPWPQRTEFGNTWWRRLYWPPLITIWHEDPETDGSDDSCGYSYARVPKRIQDGLRFEAGCEARDPWLQRDEAKRPISIVDAESKLRGAILTTARVCKVRCSHKRATEMASRLLHRPVNNLRSSMCFLPGYHSNFAGDRERGREDHAHSLYLCLARILLTEARPWWRHPRWHFWHWRIQVHPLQTFKRWAFSRCCACGGRFTYGYAPMAHLWHSTGPQWFKSEDGILHHECDQLLRVKPEASA